MYRLGDVVAHAGAGLLRDERMVVGSWLSALPAFEKAESSGAIRVLNYPLAHHAFTRRYLSEEALLEPSFAGTLDNVDRPRWVAERLDRTIALADRILVGSSFVRRSFELQGVSRDKLVVVPYGVDTHLFSPGGEQTPSGGFRIVFAGQIGQRKGISYLLRAYRRFRGPGTSLALIGRIQGDGNALAPWRDQFTHVPHMSRPALAREFRNADVFVFPTLVEGMPLVVIEAMASGLPVITTANGPGDLVRDGVDGFIVPDRNVDAIVACLERLRGDPELRAEMAANARIRSLEFTWDRYRRIAVSYIREWLGSDGR
jgi:glycosyltransferase involved in cell wall biosynthesis